MRVYHKNLVNILEIYEDEYLIYIVMEYLGGGDLYERINKNGAYSGIAMLVLLWIEYEAARVVRHISRALMTLHEQNIYHLDVKPENVIYISKEPQSDMKLADFGCSMVLDYEDDSTKEIIGSPGYIAPEVILVMRFIHFVICRVASTLPNVMSTVWVFYCIFSWLDILLTRALTHSPFCKIRCMCLKCR